jgi:hypothetical protein
MRRIFTFSFIAIALTLASFNSFGQCGGIQYTFDDGSTAGFTASGTGTSGLTNPGTSLRFNNVTAGTITLTTPTLRLPNNAINIDYGFLVGTGGNANITNLTVAIRYVNTAGQVVTTAPQAISSASPVCNTIAIPGDFSTTRVPNYQLIFTFTTTGNGNSGTNITIDSYRTTSTAGNTVLPVKFQNFEATPSSNSVSLKWMVATEENLTGYAVEKSFDGRNFSKVGFVNAANQSTYTFTDAKSSGTVYYRIKSVDVDGKYAFSTIALVKAGKSLIVLNAFPSPFVNSFSLDHGTATAGSQITISAEDGRVIKTIIPTAGSQRTPVDLSAAKAGLYLVRYKNSIGEVETLKILKQQ